LFWTIDVNPLKAIDDYETMSRGKAVTAATLVTLALLFLSNSTALAPLRTAHAATGTITPVSSGLVAADSLTTGSTSSWTFGGSASAQPGAKFGYSEDSSGLHIGVQSAAGGTWAGYYAVSGNTTATLFHSVLTLAYSSVPDNSFNTGLYVQTWNNDFIDYIGCGAVALPGGYYWTVVQAYGVLIGSQVTTTLYQSPPNTGPLTRDCTIITNGNNYLKVYLGGNVVVNRNNMTLNMPEPERAYLEPQTSTASSLLTGTYKAYYATANEGVTVTNAPVGATAELVDASNAVLASAPVAANGSATMLVGKYALPLSGSIKVIDSANNPLASTATAVSVWGGDVYTASTTSTTTSSTSSTTSSTSTTTSSTSTSSSTTTSTTSTATAIALNKVQVASGTLSIPPYQVTLSSFNAGSGSNRLLVVGVSANSNAVAGITFGGVTLTRAVISFFNNDAEMWYLTNPVGTGDIVVTMIGPTSYVVGAYSFSGVDQTNPIPMVASSHALAPSSPSVSMTTPYQNSWVIDLPSIYGGSTLASPSCAQQWDVNVANAITGASSSTVVPSPGSTTCSWAANGGGDLWDDVAIEIQA
jgi:hypothetical protein